jgi:RND family efflux transporter MFP subunit
MKGNLNAYPGAGFVTQANAVRLSMLAVATALLSGCSGDPVREPPARIVETIRTQVTTTSASDRFPATLRADDRGRLGFELAGQVARINVDVGDRFGRGQVLATLNARQQSLGVESAGAQLAQARASLREAEIDFDRKAALAGTGAIAQSDIDTARRVRDEARARVRSLQAERGRASDSLSDTRLVAPYAGVVTGRLIEPSEVVGAGEAVLEVSGTAAGLEAVITVPSSQRAAFTPGRQYAFAGTDGAPRAAVVRQVNPAAGATGLFEIILAVPNAREGGLAEGDRGEVVLEGDAGRGIMLPLSAIRMRERSRASVLLVDPRSGRTSERIVRLGAIGDEGVIVESGLRAGEVVVTKGARLVREGEIVRPTSQGPRRIAQ